MTTKITNTRKKLEVSEKPDRLITKLFSDKVKGELSEHNHPEEERKDSDSSDSKSGSMLSSAYAFESLQSESFQDSFDGDDELKLKR